MNFKKLEKQLKRSLNYLNPSAYRSYRTLLQKRGTVLSDIVTEHRKLIMIDFSSEFWHDDMGRYAYLMIKAFRIAGYQVGLSPVFSFLSRLNKYKKLLLKEEFHILKDSRIPDDTLRLSVGVQERTISVVKAKREDTYVRSQEMMAFPYMMHPHHYASYDHQQLLSFREKHREGRILFAGNADQKNYSGGKVADYYDKIPRYDVISFLDTELDSGKLHYLKDQRVLHSPPSHLLTIIRSNDFKINASDWLPTLSRFDFFLSCPGTDMPMCHNVIEAMAVGCIPLLEYPEYFHPALEDAKNCISFRGKTDLLRQLRRIEQMDAAEIAQLRKGVLSYYDGFLAPESWIRNLAESEKTVLLFDAWKLAE